MHSISRLVPLVESFQTSCRFRSVFVITSLSVLLERLLTIFQEATHIIRKACRIFSIFHTLFGKVVSEIDVMHANHNS